MGKASHDPSCAPGRRFCRQPTNERRGPDIIERVATTRPLSRLFQRPEQARPESRATTMGVARFSCSGRHETARNSPLGVRCNSGCDGWVLRAVAASLGGHGAPSLHRHCAPPWTALGVVNSFPGTVPNVAIESLDRIAQGCITRTPFLAVVQQGLGELGLQPQVGSSCWFRCNRRAGMHARRTGIRSFLGWRWSPTSA